MRKLISLILLLSLSLGLMACADKDDEFFAFKGEGPYNPYYCLYKPDVPTGKKISVEGKTFYYEEMQLRDKDGTMLDKAQVALDLLYCEGNIRVVFVGEDTLIIKDNHNRFAVAETQGERRGNVIMLSAPNKTGDFTYEIRVEIHKDCIYLIHNGHTYDQEGSYITIKFMEY